MPCSDWVLEWVLLHLLLHSCELAHLLAEVDLAPCSPQILVDAEELSERWLWEPISAVPSPVASPEEDEENPIPPASVMNQTDIQVCRRMHWT